MSVGSTVSVLSPPRAKTDMARCNVDAQTFQNLSETTQIKVLELTMLSTEPSGPAMSSNISNDDMPLGPCNSQEMPIAWNHPYTMKQEP